MSSYYDIFGMRHHRDDVEAELIADMMFPVRCTWCSRIYDVAKVEVTARYTDCSMWKSPCCGRVVDDRGEGWKPRADFTRIPKGGWR
jgi:hypothetical protein